MMSVLYIRNEQEQRFSLEAISAKHFDCQKHKLVNIPVVGQIENEGISFSGTLKVWD